MNKQFVFVDFENQTVIKMTKEQVETELATLYHENDGQIEFGNYGIFDLNTEKLVDFDINVSAKLNLG